MIKNKDCLSATYFFNIFVSLSSISKHWYNRLSDASSGTLFPSSHFEIVCLVTYTESASSCCVSPFFILAYFITFAMSIYPPLSPVTTRHTVDRNSCGGAYHDKTHIPFPFKQKSIYTCNNKKSKEDPSDPPEQFGITI